MTPCTGLPGGVQTAITGPAVIGRASSNTGLTGTPSKAKSL